MRVLKDLGGTKDLMEMLKYLEPKLRLGALPIIRPREQFT